MSVKSPLVTPNPWKESVGWGLWALTSRSWHRYNLCGCPCSIRIASWISLLWDSNRKLIYLLWWLILHLNLTGLPDAGKTLFLCVSIRVSMEEIIIWISKPSKDHPTNVGEHRPTHWGPEWSKKAKEKCICDTHPPLPLDVSAPGSQAVRPGLNYPINFLDFPVYRQQSMGFLSLHNHVTHFLY